jgi:hypothetical protein
MNKILLGLGVLLIVLAGVWKFGISPNSEKRFSEDWSWKLETIGAAGYPDDQGNFPPNEMQDDPFSISSRDITIDYPKNDEAKIQDKYTSYDAVTNAVTWEYTYTAELDPKTGEHKDQADTYYFFPRHLDKTQTYKISNTSYPALPLKFEKEEAVEGLNTYVFAFHGSYDNSSAYEGTATLEENQDIRCVNLDLIFWVEPLTGETVKYHEWCEGDEIYNTETDEHVAWLSRWWGETKAEDIITRVDEVKSQRQTLLLTTQYIPLGLLVIGLGLVAVGGLRLRKSSTIA